MTIKDTRKQVDISKIDELDGTTLYEFAKLDYADVKAARAAKRTKPATPFHDELTRRNDVRNSTKAAKKNGTGGSNVRITDAELTKLVHTAMKKGVNTPQRVVNAIRAAGGSSSLKRVRLIFEQTMKSNSELAKIVNDSLAEKTSKPAATSTAPAAAPAKVTGAVKKQTPGAKRRAAANPTPVLSELAAKAGLKSKSTKMVTPIPKRSTAKKQATKTAARKSA